MTRGARIVTSWLRSTALAVIVLTATATHAIAQPGGEAPPPADKLVQVRVAPVQIPAGGTANVTVHLTLLPGWHVNANPPALDYNIPTKVELTGTAGVTAGAARYPKGSSHKFAFEEKPLLVYDSAADVLLPVSAAATAVPGAHTLTGKVEFQACNDQVCLAPASVPFTVQVTVSAGAAQAATTPDTASAPAGDSLKTFATAPTSGGTATRTGGSGSAVAKNRLEQTLAKGGLGWILALFVGGLLLNLTPCVFPMLGVTVSIRPNFRAGSRVFRFFQAFVVRLNAIADAGENPLPRVIVAERRQGFRQRHTPQIMRVEPAQHIEIPLREFVMPRLLRPLPYDRGSRQQRARRDHSHAHRPTGGR